MNKAAVAFILGFISLMFLQVNAAEVGGELEAQGFKQETIGGVEYYGLLHRPLGNAVLTLVDDTLEVSKIGGGGADGVRVDLPANSQLEWFSSLVPFNNSSDGSFIRVQNVGELSAGEGVEPLSSIQFTEDAGELIQIANIPTVVIDGASVRAPLFADGFEAGNFFFWSLTNP